MYRVTYEVAHGRPYSKLEELLLRAVNDAEGSTGRTFGELRDTFLVHDRLLTEALVTLIQEGWVAMVQQENEVHYLVTKEGRLTIEHGRRPSKLRVQTRHARIVRENLTGQLARSSDLRLVTGPNAVRATGVRSWKKYTLTPRMQRTKINGGETEPLLPRSRTQQEWIRWIDSVARLNQDLYYLPVQVDLAAAEVMGLPYQWRTLKSMILDEVTARQEDFADDPVFQEKLSQLMLAGATENGRRTSRGTAGTLSANPFAEAPVRCADLALTARAGRSLAESVLADCTGNVMLVVARMDEEKAGVAREVLSGLRRRGVNADLLWSLGGAAADTDDADGTAEKEIARGLGAARGAPGTGKVAFNRTSAPVATDLVLATTQRGPVAVIGADLLRPSAAEDRFGPAVRFSAPAALATVARLCAGWWEELPGEDGSLPAHRWKHLAERWSGEAARALGAGPAEPGERSAHCSDKECEGMLSLLIGPRSAALREEVGSGQAQRILTADGGLALDELVEQTACAPPSEAGGQLRATGGADGWRVLERTSDDWKPTEWPALPAPADHCRVAAADDEWLVEYAGAHGSALSFGFRGHVAARAWDRMCADRQSD
ncbi:MULTISPECIES: hypothetical protein [Streptomyces]|uniref:Uncharacterized protein n=2 Tax=Streptomyces TaxID=1883 RepID=A0ABV9IXP2_9ACTN